MRKHLNGLLLIIILGTASCRVLHNSASTKKDDGKIEVVFVQVNDVYEIAPLAGGKVGGMARVATLKKQYKKINPNTLLVIAGDFVSPSVFNSLQYQGKRIRGKQMIEAMNSAGMDLAVFGNHEFDISESELQERINESDFQWVSSNTFHLVNGNPQPFEKFHNGAHSSFPKTCIMSFRDADGTVAKIGFIGLTLPFNKADYVSYTDPLSTAKEAYYRIKDSCDAVVAITHQLVQDDSILAMQLPGLACILGGHEHDMRFGKYGNVYVTKAHANAKSAYVVKLTIDKNVKSLNVVPELHMLDEKVALDSATSLVVKKWMDVGEQNYASLGFEASQVLIQSGDTLEGRESEIRSRPTNFTRLVAAAMADACPEADVVIFNAGSIRVDDRLSPPISQYDIIRSLPFGGGIREAEIKGSLLRQVLDAGLKNAGTGGFLQYQPVAQDAATGQWIIGQAAIDTQKVYKIAIADFLVSGKEVNLGFLNKDNPGMISLKDAETSPASSKSDIRLAMVRYLQKKH